MSSGRKPRVALVWTLACAGALCGAIVGTLQARPQPSAKLNNDEIARVGDRSLSRAEFNRTLAQYALSFGGRSGPREREHVLQLLIEEELLAQHAIATGLYRTEGELRYQVLSTVAGSISTDIADSTESGPQDAAEERRADAAFAQYLQWLRARSRIERDPELSR